MVGQSGIIGGIRSLAKTEVSTETCTGLLPKRIKVFGGTEIFVDIELLSNEIAELSSIDRHVYTKIQLRISEKTEMKLR